MYLVTSNPSPTHKAEPAAPASGKRSEAVSLAVGMATMSFAASGALNACAMEVYGQMVADVTVGSIRAAEICLEAQRNWLGLMLPQLYYPGLAATSPGGAARTHRLVVVGGTAA